MSKKNPVLVLASANDPQFTMLNGLPHTICSEVATCAQAAKDATVILQWSGSRDLLRAAFAVCNRVRWIHSRAAGLDNLLFPELVESPVLLTNGRGVLCELMKMRGLPAERFPRWECAPFTEKDRADLKEGIAKTGAAL